MEVRSVLKLKQRSGCRKANKSKSFVSGNNKKTKTESTQSNSKNNCFKISRPAPMENLVETTEQFWKRSMVEDNFLTPYSKVDFSSHRRVTDNSIENMKLKESPNYQSIMDLWSDSVAKYDDDEMGNTDENIASDERMVPKTLMINLVSAIRNKCIPKDLDKLLQNCSRFRIFSCIEKSFINEDQYASVMSKKYNSNQYNTNNKPQLKEKGLKDLIDKNKMGNGYENKIDNKEICDDSDLDISDIDPQATICAEESHNLIQPVIQKNTIPVFTTKTMEMTRCSSEYNKFATLNILEELEDEKQTNPLNKLVSKMPINSSVQILK